MAARLQLARAASSLSSASETCVSSAAALQQLLDSLSAAQGIENEMPDSSRSPSQSCRQPEHQQQQVRHRIRQQEDRYSAIAHHAAHHQQLITTCNAITAVQAASRRAKDSRLLDEGLQPQHHTSLTADSVQWQQRHQLSELCDYKPTSPSKDASGSGSSSTSSASQSSKAASSSGTAAVQHDSLAAALMAITNSSKAAQLTPKSIVERLDKHIVGQASAKRAVAVALRNRWRRHKLPARIAEEITPKNILMIGPTGCGKTEIARRLAKLVEAPFVKVEATKFTELGFVGRDVDEIVKDLMEASFTLTKTRLAAQLRAAALAVVEEMLVTALVGPHAGQETFSTFRHLYRNGGLESATVEIDLDALSDITGAASSPPFGGLGAAASGGNPLGAIAHMFGQANRQGGGADGQGRTRGRGKAKMTVSEARKLLIDAEVERFLNSDRVVKEALRAAQEDGIVFIDEIDKIVDTSKGAGGATSSNVSSEGVQRDLLPILEGSVVATKYGNVSTEHVLFIASGAFHSSKPGDMLAELQGRLPVKVELAGLTADDFYRILTEPQHNMIRQQQVLLATEGVDLHFTHGAVRAVAKAAEDANTLLDNIGARRLHTVLERVLADISFEAPEKVAAANRDTDSSSYESDAGLDTARQQSNSYSTSSSNGGSQVSGESAGPGGAATGSIDDLPVRFEVTEAMVEACMKPMLKHIDISKYLL